MIMSNGVLHRYKSYLPVDSGTPMISLGEGGTPLVQANRLGRYLGCQELYFKLEGSNPTGSFKDRGMVVAVAKAIQEGSHGIVCASTGNTSASAASYAAHFEIPATVLVPKGDVSAGKLSQARAYGARILFIDGNFDLALSLVRELASRHPLALVNSVNPYRIDGQKTGAFEIVDDLGDAPDLLCIPVGNAGNITAYWKGFEEYHRFNKTSKTPRMMGFQASGAAPIVLGARVEDPQTIASAIRIGNPASWSAALRATEGSGGSIEAVDDEEIVEAYKLLGSEEGIFCEPASAACVAGLIKMYRSGVDLRDKRVACIITGTGLKDPDFAATTFGAKNELTASNLKEVEKALLAPIT